MSNLFVIGHTDGASSMLAYFHNIFQRLTPQGRLLTLVENPTTDPDILIYSVFGEQHKRYNCKKILLCGEPGDVSHHHADLVIDCKDVARFRPPSAVFHYLPFYVLSFGERFKNKPTDLIKPPEFNVDQIVAQKTKFCAFLYSQQVDFRNSLFDVISRYKPVDALGRARGRPGQPIDRSVYQVGVQTYNDLAVQKYQPYKFVICAENSRHVGYITEKMISAMLANAIPIYLGAPDVVQHFNPNSFVHVGDHANWEHAVTKIKEIDTDISKYKAMLRQPWFHNNQLNSYFASNYTDNVIQAIINKPAPTNRPAPLNRLRIGPRLTSTLARVKRHIAHNRVAAIRSVRKAPVRITTPPRSHFVGTATRRATTTQRGTTRSLTARNPRFYARRLRR